MLRWWMMSKKVGTKFASWRHVEARYAVDSFIHVWFTRMSDASLMTKNDRHVTTWLLLPSSYILCTYIHTYHIYPELEIKTWLSRVSKELSRDWVWYDDVAPSISLWTSCETGLCSQWNRHSWTVMICSESRLPDYSIMPLEAQMQCHRLFVALPW